jgi:hypothetical protein
VTETEASTSAAPVERRQVPYFSQWMSPAAVRAIVEDGADPCDDPAWPAAGFDSAADYRFWAVRTCGLACLESILAFWEIPTPSRAELVERALKWGAYRHDGPGRVEGLIYRPFADWVACDFGLQADVHPHLDLDAVAALDPGWFAILSVSSKIRGLRDLDGPPGGHLVLAHSWGPDGIVCHNPSGVPPQQANTHLDWATFGRYFARRGIVVRPPSSALSATLEN